MKKELGILILGLIVAAMPFLGFPHAIERIVISLSGLFIVFLAFLLRTAHSEANLNESTESYVQNGGTENHESEDNTA